MDSFFQPVPWGPVSGRGRCSFDNQTSADISYMKALGIGGTKSLALRSVGSGLKKSNAIMQALDVGAECSLSI